MDITEAVDVLRKHNEWRRYNGPVGEGPAMQEPHIIGVAIDVVVNYYSNHVDHSSTEQNGKQPINSL